MKYTFEYMFIPQMVENGDFAFPNYHDFDDIQSLEYNVFSPAMIDGIIKRLRSYNDKTLRADINGNQEEMLKLVNQYFHCG